MHAFRHKQQTAYHICRIGQWQETRISAFANKGFVYLQL
jgi:hypothetical protein